MVIRSLGQQEDRELIEQNIFSTLQNKTVKEWYKNRLPENKQEKQANMLMEKNELQALVSFYRSWPIREQRMKKNHGSLFQRGRNIIKSIIS